MMNYVLGTLLGRRTSFKEYAELENHHCQVAQRIAGMCALTPSARYLVEVMNDRIMIFDRRVGTSAVPVVLNDTVNSNVPLFATDFVSIATTDYHVYIGTVHKLVYEVDLVSRIVRNFLHEDLSLVARMAVVGKNMLTCSIDSTWRYWTMTSDGKLELTRVNSVPGDNVILALALSPDDSSKGLVSCGLDCLYIDFLANETILTLKGHADAIRACAIRRHLAITGSFDMSARVWELHSGTQLHRLDGHLWFILGVALSWDGSRAVTCSLDRTVKVWDLGTEAKQLFELPDHSDAIKYLSISRSARYLCTGTEDRVVSLFDLNHGDALRLLALCSAGHSRLGKNSPANAVPQDVIQRIAEFLMHLAEQ